MQPDVMLSLLATTSAYTCSSWVFIARRYASAGSIYLLTEISCGAMSRYPAECTVVHCSTASVMKDMLRIKSRQAEIPGFSSSDVDFILECLCVS